MPGNTIVINNSKQHEWYVGDSKMDLLIAFLNEIGFRKKKENAICPNCEGPLYPWRITKTIKALCAHCGKPLMPIKITIAKVHNDNAPNKRPSILQRSEGQQ